MSGFKMEDGHLSDGPGWVVLFVKLNMRYTFNLYKRLSDHDRSFKNKCK